MTRADRDVRIVWGGRQAGGWGGVEVPGEVRTGSALLIKHYSTVINILPPQLRPQNQYVEPHQHHRLFLHARPASLSLCGANLDNYAF